MSDAVLGGLEAPRSSFRNVWRTDYVKVLVMSIAFVVEYLPVTIWHLIGTALHCAR